MSRPRSAAPAAARAALWGNLCVVLSGGPALAAEIEVLHYWISPSERAALDTIREAFERRGGQWIDEPAARSIDLRRRLVERAADGLPVPAFQWMGGEVEELRRLDAAVPVPGAAAWIDKLPESVRAQIMSDQQPYMAPVGIHIENKLWLSARLLAENGLPVPRSWDEVVAIGTTLAAKGVAPVVTGGEIWQQSLIVRAVLAESQSDEPNRTDAQTHWRRYVTSASFRRAVHHLAALKPLVRPPSRGDGWVDALVDVGEGRAAMTFMGDWAKGEYARHGMKVDKDVLCAVPPGNEKVMTLVVDGFAFSAADDRETLEAQRLLADTLMDPEVQLAFALDKGSAPTRKDVPPNRLDSCSVADRAKLEDPRVRKDQIRIDARRGVGALRVWDLLIRLLVDPALSEEEVLARIDRLAAEAE
ncbi:ABC transporter substrate-binding protein [Prosthecomicrobium sp. N25]|uniref:ABC transporter substrate-binding protein n=1 Tax=Prosthecomicrobium sp. N25 TaxID=3129254 RepID=UPI003077042A